MSNRAPDVTGPGNWEGWIVRSDQGPAAVRVWLVCCPGAHMFWSWWMLGCVDLAPHPDMPPAHKRYDSAEYEIAFVALDPGETDKGVDVEAVSLPAPLSPPDLVVQFHGVTRETARDVLDLCVHRIMTGQVSPDSDFRSWWERAIQGTVACTQRGQFPPPAGAGPQ